jgi:Zn-dependent protease with chaperone function
LASEPHTIARGEWHKPHSSAHESATLEERDGVIVALSNAGEVRAGSSFDGLTISERVGSVPRRITFPDGSLFETADNVAIDMLVSEKRGKNAGWIHRAEAFHPRLIAFVAGTVVLLMLMYRYALPALVEVAVAVTPPVIPQAMSSGTLASLDRTFLSASELPEEKIEPIRDGFAQLTKLTERGPEGFNLNFRKGGIVGPNAFALPDGTLVVTDELVELAKGDTDMIVAVLGHEIGHVELKHSLRQLYRALGVAGLIMLIGGDVGDGVEDILVEGGGLLSLSYSRGAESAADAHGVRMMIDAKRDPEALARFFEVLEKELSDTSDTSFFNTHPGTPERKQAVRDLAARLKMGNGR